MNREGDSLFLPAQGFRWFGPADPVPLNFIRQAGAEVVFTSLHQIPYGELWPAKAIQERKEIIEAAGLRWTVVESVPVHEDVKLGAASVKRFFSNYRQTLRHLAAEGVQVVVYNFMPVLDWVRTDMRRRLPDGAECLSFNPVHLAAFEIHALRRPGAETDYTAEQVARAGAWWKGCDEAGRQHFIQSIIDVFPGVKLGLSLDDVRAMLARYAGLDGDDLRVNLERFLEAVIPTAEEVGIRLAVHPDDPPFSILGLPRIVSTANDVKRIFQFCESVANGLCFCTGSFSVRPENDIPAMVREFGDRIHAGHLRSTQREADGSFYEASHLAGSVDMPAVVSELLRQIDLRRAAGRPDWRLSFRPDHGHTMMDDLGKHSEITPGYSCIGRTRGLAELRGLMFGLRSCRDGRVQFR